MSASMRAVAVMRVSAVLQDCVDQLAVLGNVMSGTQRDTNTATTTTAASRAVSEVLQQHKDAELQLKAARGGNTQARGVSEAVQELHRTQKELQQSVMDSPLSSEYATKVQSDRRFVVRLIGELLTELKEEGTFHSLINTVEEEKRTKAQLQEIIIREEEDRLRIKSLQKLLVDLRRETMLHIQERDKMAAHLEDQLQERKIKKSLQEKYLKSSTQLLVYQGQKLNNHNEKQLEEEIEMLKKKLMEEENSYGHLEIFLKNSQTSLEDNLEYWMERYDKDTEDKQRELNTVKTNKTNNLTQLQDLAKKYRESEEVIIEDRLEKEKLRKQLEEEQLQNKAAVKIQSWWRGTMVRKGLGPYRKKKSKQKKDGKKGKKKK